VNVTDGTPLSTLCTALKYDAADRLIQMTKYPTSTTAQRTLFAYDGNGNIVSSLRRSGFAYTMPIVTASNYARVRGRREPRSVRRHPCADAAINLRDPLLKVACYAN